jgi:hypothetical protein
VRANAEEPLSHRFKSGHLLDAVRVEVLELQPVHEQHPRMNRPMGMEKPRSWKTTNDTTYPLGGCGTDSSASTMRGGVDGENPST